MFIDLRNFCKQEKALYTDGISRELASILNNDDAELFDKAEEKWQEVFREKGRYKVSSVLIISLIH